MVSPTQPIRDEHKKLIPHLETMLRVADSVGAAPAERLLQDVDKIYDFLAQRLIPHAYAEDQALYPYIGNILGAPEAADTMSRDHLEVRWMVEQLTALRAQLNTEPINAFRANELRRMLYGLYAVLKLHFAKEEEIYLPLLDAASTPEDMKEVYEAMQRAANQARIPSRVTSNQFWMFQRSNS